MSKEITVSEAKALLAPFVDAKVNRKRDPESKYGAYLPLTREVDIVSSSRRIDADVRFVNDEGVGDFFYRGVDLIPWASIKELHVREYSEQIPTRIISKYKIIHTQDEGRKK